MHVYTCKYTGTYMCMMNVYIYIYIYIYLTPRPKYPKQLGTKGGKESYRWRATAWGPTAGPPISGASDKVLARATARGPTGAYKAGPYNWATDFGRQ